MLGDQQKCYLLKYIQLQETHFNITPDTPIHARAQTEKIIHLSSSDSTTLTGSTLSRAQMLLTTCNSLRLLNYLLTLGQDQFDVAWVRHVWVDLQIMLVLVGVFLTEALGVLTRP